MYCICSTSLKHKIGMHIPAVILSPNAITTFISCGLSSYTFCADLVKGGRLGQLNSSAKEEDK